jgi:hypothetical protein
METTKNLTLSKSTGMRKPYSKPNIEQVQLLPDENVLGGCNSISISNTANPIGCSAPTACIN